MDFSDIGEFLSEGKNVAIVIFTILSWLLLWANPYLEGYDIKMRIALTICFPVCIFVVIKTMTRE